MAGDFRRLVELGMVPALAKEVATCINAGTVSAIAVRRLTETSMVPREIRELRNQLSGASAKSAKRWTEIGVSPRLAKELVTQMGGIAPPVLVISGTPAGAAVGNSTAFTPFISGGVPPYVLSLLSGTLPAGRSIVGNSVTGTYTTAASYSYTLRVTDSASATANLPVSETVASSATVPGAPTVAVTPGNTQNFVAWVDGSNGGSTITAHKVYGSTTSGFTPGGGNLLYSGAAASPYVHTGLTNGTPWYYKVVAVNIVGDSNASTEQSGTPAGSTQATRSATYNIFGSSTRFGQEADTTPDLRGNAVPPAYIGKTPALVVQGATLPNDTSAPVVNNLAASGQAPEAILGSITTRVSSPGITGQDSTYYAGINDGANKGSYNYDDTYRYAYVAQMRTALVSGGARNTLYATTNLYVAQSEDARSQHRRLANRMVKVIYELNDPTQSWGDYSYNGLAWAGDADLVRTTGAPGTGSDLEQQLGNSAPSSLLVGAHPSGYGYTQLTRGCDIPHAEAWGDGPCHFPRMQHYFEVATAGVLGRVHFTGDLAGTTINVTTPNFSIAKVAGRPVMSCTAIPAAGVTDVSGTVSKNGFTRPFTIPVSVSPTPTTQPKWVSYQGNISHRINSRSALGSADQLTLFIALAIEEDDGSNLLIPAGGADARIHTLIADNGITASGGVLKIGRDSAGFNISNIPAIGGGTVVNGNFRTSSVRNIASGRCGLFIEIDRLAGTTKAWITAGLGATPGTPTVDAGVLIGATSTAAAIDLDKMFGQIGSRALQSNTAAAQVPFTGQLGRVWATKGILGCTDPAKRALLWNNTTGVVDTGGSTVGGLTPFLDIRGNAAERWAGAIYRNSPSTDLGGTTCKNEGTGGDLLTFGAFPCGKMTTVP